MNEDFPEPTALELSRAATGYRYYIVSETVYSDIASAVDASRGYPKGDSLSAFPPVEELPEATDGSGKLFVVSTFSVDPSDDDLLDPLIVAGALEEVDEATFLALLPVTEDEPFNE